MSDNPQELIVKGLMKCMRPMQALVMTAIYQQFPERYIPRNGYFFPPSIAQITRALKVKDSVVYLMLHNLVESGWLEQKKGKRGMEYKIVFDKLKPFVDGETSKKTATVGDEP